MLAGDDPGIQNPLLGSKDDRALSRDDIPQSLILAWSYELPFGKGKKYNSDRTGECDCRRLDDRCYTTLRLGASAGITMACDFCSYIFSNVKRPNKVGGGYGKTQV